jgi:hypothetical protein
MDSRVSFINNTITLISNYAIFGIVSQEQARQQFQVIQRPPKESFSKQHELIQPKFPSLHFVLPSL